jgi:single-strand DNA-binding protein
MNQITIAGHLGADPEVRFTSSSKKVTTLRVAARTRRSSKDKDDTIWWRVTVWGEEFDNMILHFKKGSPIIVHGVLSKPEIFTDREGRPQISMNITATSLEFSPFGKPDHSGSNERPMQGEPAYAHAQQVAAGQGESRAEDDDEIPF